MALNDQMQQMVQQDIQDAETRPKEEILKEQMEGLKTAGRTARDIAVESIPGVSEALAEKRVDEALQRGDTTGAMIEGAAGLMGAVPMVGDAAAKGLRVVTQSLRKQDIGEAEKLVDNPEKLQEWRDTNRLPESQRQKNISEAQQAAEDLFQRKIKSKEARKRIKETFPEPKLYTAENMPEMPTVTDVVGSMGKKAEKGILGVKGFDLEPGQRVGARLDIPAYNEYDKWVVSIHDGKSRNGSVVGYGQAIRLKNIEFGSDPKVALDIAKGKRVAKTTGEEKPMGKATIARVFGDYVPEDPYELEEFAKKALADKDSGWTQVGMNPYRGSYFYDKATGTPVTRADEVIQVGPLVLAKNVTKPKMSELKEMFNTPAARTADGKLRVFNKGGAVPMNNMSKQMELFEPVERGFDEGGVNLSSADIEKAKQDAEKITALKKQKTDERLNQLDAAVTEKAKNTRDQMTKLTEMLTSGDVKKLSPEEQEKFVKLYKLLQSQGYNEGGLMDEGGMVDEESGNEVPPGSLREEVRDDIPAQLSEGEFVFPADVVRYIGLENLMRMRQEAKQGLAQMEAMGQMGNSEEAVMPDNLPFNMYDLDIEEDEEYNMASGGVIKAANGTLATGTYKLPNTTGSYTTPAPVTTGYTPPPTLTQPFQPYTPQFTTATQEQGAFIPKTIDPLSPTFGEFIGQNIPGVDFDYVDYINDAGQIIKLRVDKATGELLDPIPEGYRLKTEEVQKTTSETQRVETAKVRDDGGRDDAGDRSPPGASTAFGGELVDGQVVGGYVGDLSFDNMSIKQAQSYMLSGVPSFLGQLAGKPNTNTLPDDAIANITNLSKTRPKGVYSGPAKVEFAATVRMKGTTYNDLLTGKMVTQRQKMADAIDFIKQKYGDDVMDPSKIIDLDIELADMNMREDVRDAIDRSDLSDAIKDTLSKNNDIGNVSVDKDGNISINNPFEASRLDQASTGDYGDAYKDDTAPSGPSGPSAETVAEADAAGAIGYEGNQYDGGKEDKGGYDSGRDNAMDGGPGFSQGGLAKQMKRSGLASKK